MLVDMRATANCEDHNQYSIDIEMMKEQHGGSEVKNSIL